MLKEELDQFGGWIGKKFEATGFFRVEKDDRWWLVTPEGTPQGDHRRLHQRDVQHRQGDGVMDSRLYLIHRPRRAPRDHASREHEIEQKATADAIGPLQPCVAGAEDCCTAPNQIFDSSDAWSLGIRGRGWCEFEHSLQFQRRMVAGDQKPWSTNRKHNN